MGYSPHNLKTNAELVRYLVDKGILVSKPLIKAFEEIDRQDFVVPSERKNAYRDYPLPIGYGQTISQPSTIAFMLELLKPQKGEKILDLGSGSGRTSALLSKVVGATGHVYGVEIIPELVERGRKNLEKYHLSQATILPAGKEYGLPEQAPFDKILVSAAGSEVPLSLLKQLKTGGLMVIPIKNSLLRLQKISDQKILTEEYPGFVFVPLVNPEQRRPRRQYRWQMF